jgi:integrase
MVSVSFWHATGTVCRPPGLASPSVHKYKAQHDYKNDAEHKHQAANAEAMTRLRDHRDTGHRYTVPRECYAQRGCTVSRYVLNTRRSTHWSPYRLGPGRCGRRDCTGLLALVLVVEQRLDAARAGPAVAAVGLEGVHIHDLRHTGNQFTANAGANTRELMVRMGHDSERAALIYLHSSDKRQRSLADAVAKAARAELAQSKKAKKPGRSGTRKPRSRNERSKS